jgi:diguanylate cyclase (GGDEF)-like protein
MITLPGLVTLREDAARRERPVLTILTGVLAGKVLPLEQAETTFGRSRECTVRLDDSDVSRRHMRILQSDGRFVLEDLGSRNGTYLGTRAVQRAELEDGDKIQLGPNLVLRFSLLEAAEEALAKQLFEASTSDALTRVANRRYFDDRLASEIAFAQRHGTELSLLVFDVDHFKRVNDTWGHAAGDIVLRIVAAQVRRTVRVEDLLARIGGEEFAVLVRGVGREGLARLAERVRLSVSRLQVPWQGAEISVTVSLGGALLSESRASTVPAERSSAKELAAALVRLADERLYLAKQMGRNRAYLR